MAHQANIAVYFREDKYIPSTASDRIDKMRAEFDEKLAALLQEGLEQGIFKVDDVRLTTLAVGGMISWMFTWYRTGGRLSDEHIADQMIELVMRTVGYNAPKDAGQLPDAAG